MVLCNNMLSLIISHKILCMYMILFLHMISLFTQLRENKICFTLFDGALGHI